MVWRNFCFSLMILAPAGCSVPQKEHITVSYRKSVQKEIKALSKLFENQEHYHWTTPLVQEVNVPAHLSNGVMIPEHNEFVIIKPGEWTTNQQRKIYDQATTDKGVDVSNITILPKPVGQISSSD